MAVDKNINILLVEDSGSMRKMEMMILKKLGFSNIVEAEDGKESVTIVESGQVVDLVVSDWNMPNMNGFELLVWIRANDMVKDVPFLMATARGEKSQTKAAEDAGVSGMVPKPFTPADMSAKIEEVFDADKAVAEKAPAVRQPVITKDGKVSLNVSHIQITDHLILGVLKNLIERGEVNPKHFELTTHCQAGWNPVLQSLGKAEADAAFILAPIAMDMFNCDVPIKLVLLAHKNGSTFVRKKSSSNLSDIDFQEPLIARQYRSS